MESEKIDFHEKVYNGYNLMSEKEPDRFVKINAVGDPESISKLIIKAVINKFKELNE